MCPQNNLLPQPVRTKYVDNEDMLVMEDETERVALIGNITVGTTVTGDMLMLLITRVPFPNNTVGYCNLLS